MSAAMGWFESLPDEMIRSDPSLSVGYAWGLFLSGQIDAIETRLQDAQTALAGLMASGDSEQVAELFGEIATLRSFLLRVQGEPVSGIALAEQVLAQVPDDNLAGRGILHTILGGLYRDVGDLARASQFYADAIPINQSAGNVTAAIMAVDLLVRLLVVQGQLTRAAEVCRQILESDTQGKQQAMASDIVGASMGNVLYEWNELAGAEARVRKGIEQSKRGGFFQLMLHGQILLARVLQARRDTDGANDALQDAARSARMNPPRWYRAELDACQVQLWLGQGNLAAASRWARESDLSAEAEFKQGHEFEHITLARVLVAQGRMESDGTILAQSLGLLERMSQAAELAGRMGHLIELLILRALALEGQGDLDRSLGCLERALGLAEPQGYVRAFVDQGAGMARLLREAARRGIVPVYAGRLLEAIEAQGQPGLPAPCGAATLPAASPLIDPLSKRELQVLHLMAEGLTYNEIAGQITVSLNTVRTHVKNIYSKLLVHKRSQAIAKAKELNLL